MSLRRVIIPKPGRNRNANSNIDVSDSKDKGDGASESNFESLETSENVVGGESKLESEDDPKTLVDKIADNIRRQARMIIDYEGNLYDVLADADGGTKYSCLGFNA